MTPASTPRTALTLYPPTPEIADALEELLWTVDGVESVTRHYDTHEAFDFLEVIGLSDALVDDTERVLTLNALAEQVKIGTPRSIEEADWAECWKQYWHVTRLLPNVVIQPSWEDFTPETGDIVIHLDPGSAFGTGTHETTQLMLLLINDYLDAQPSPIETMLDVGTGSGILAIYAKKRGVPTVDATDNDPLAVSVALENAENNHVAIPCSTSELAALPEYHYDLVVSNILASVLCELMGDLKKRVKPGGTLMLSGIAREQFGKMKDSIDAHGLTLKRISQKGGWIALVCEVPR